MNAILLSFLAGAATGLGALGIFFIRRLSPKLEDAMLSVAAGIMLSASFFSLILPGLESARQLGFDKVLSATVVIFGIVLGAVLVWTLHHFAPHEHFVLGRQGPDSGRLARVWLFVITITLHNLPEGMAVGIGASASTDASGISLAFGIGLQNIPEGLAVAAALLSVGYDRTRAAIVSLLTGLVEGLGGFIGAVAGWFARPVMPWALGFAAGAMLFIISDEVIPETHRRNNASLATFSLLGGFVIMMFLDSSFG